MNQIISPSTPYLGLWTRPVGVNGPHQGYIDYNNPDIYENMVILDQECQALAEAISLVSGGPLIEINGTRAGSQTLLNLKASTGITITDDGHGNISFSASGTSVDIEVNGTPAGSQTLLNLTAGANMQIIDDGVGDITFVATPPGGVSLLYDFSTSTSAPSSNAGTVNFDNATFANIANLYFTRKDRNGNDITGLVIGNGINDLLLPGQVIAIYTENNPTGAFAIFLTLGGFVESANYFTVTVKPLGGTVPANNAQVSLGFSLGGTVTSVNLSMPSIFTVAGSPVLSSGTLAVSLANENVNLVFAGPASGSAAVPTFRSLVRSDLPQPNRVTGIMSAPYSNTSASPLSSGFGVGPITPSAFGSILITGNVFLENNTVAFAPIAELWRTSGSIPAQGSAPGGSDTQLLVLGFNEPVAGGKEFLCIACEDYGLSTTTAYSYYLTLHTSGGTGAQTSTLEGSGLAGNVSLVATEF